MPRPSGGYKIQRNTGSRSRPFTSSLNVNSAQPSSFSSWTPPGLMKRPDEPRLKRNDRGGRHRSRHWGHSVGCVKPPDPYSAKLLPAASKCFDGRTTPSRAPGAQGCTCHGLRTAALAGPRLVALRAFRLGSLSPPPVLGERGAPEEFFDSLDLLLGGGSGGWRRLHCRRSRWVPRQCAARQ